jgi:2-polyprenyl-3-methyl-5-hydroxy-6-metoxy-1,4-benzoquinol methylase
MNYMDSVKKFWNDRPCNIRHGTAEVGTRDYFDQVEQRKYMVEPHIPGFAEFDIWKGKSVLEIGTGIGTDTINFMRSGADVTSIDLSEESVHVAKKRAEIYGFEPDRIMVQNAEEFSFNKNFDLVYSFGVIHHTPNPRAVIERAAAHQSRGQELRIMVYSKISYKLFWAMHENNRWYMETMDDTIREFAEAQTGCPIAYTYTFDQIRELLAPWYEITDIHKDHIFKWNVQKYIKYEYEVDDAWKNVSPENFRALEEELGWHTLVKAKRA